MTSEINEHLFRASVNFFDELGGDEGGELFNGAIDQITIAFGGGEPDFDVFLAYYLNFLKLEEAKDLSDRTRYWAYKSSPPHNLRDFTTNMLRNAAIAGNIEFAAALLRQNLDVDIIRAALCNVQVNPTIKDMYATEIFVHDAVAAALENEKVKMTQAVSALKAVGFDIDDAAAEEAFTSSLFKEDEIVKGRDIEMSINKYKLQAYQFINSVLQKMHAATSNAENSYVYAFSIWIDSKIKEYAKRIEGLQSDGKGKVVEVRAVKSTSETSFADQVREKATSFAKRS